MKLFHVPTTAAAVAFGAVASFTSPAAAGPAVLLGPGDVVQYDSTSSPEYQFPAADTLVAEMVRPLTVTLYANTPYHSDGDYDYPYVESNPRFFSPTGPAMADQPATLTSRVYRDTSDGTLTFAYEVALSPVAAVGGSTILDLTEFSVDAFGDLDTHVFARINPTVTLDRFDRTDPGEIFVSGDFGGGPRAPFRLAQLVVETDATVYDTHGSGAVYGIESYDLDTYYDYTPTDGSGPTRTIGPIAALDSIRYGGFDTFNGVFAPAVGPAVVPLPSGLWGGLATLGGVGLTGAVRRRRARFA